MKYYVDDEIKLKWTENTKITRDNSEVDSILVCGFSCQNALENYSPPQGVIDDNVITLTSNDISSTEITSVEVDSSGGSGYQVLDTITIPSNDLVAVSYTHQKLPTNPYV